MCFPKLSRFKFFLFAVFPKGIVKSCGTREFEGRKSDILL